jgi:HlyD family secretion protein
MSHPPAARPAQIAEILGPPRPRRARVLYWLLAAALGLGALAFALAPRDAAPGLQFRTEPATRGALQVRVTATGTLEPVNQVDVGTEVSGTIQQVTVDHNDRVTSGQVLARLDTSQLEARLRQSLAALSLAQARVREAEATVTETGNRLRRTRDLIARRLSSEEELDAASAASLRAEAILGVAKAQVDQAQAEVDTNRRILEKASIRSPIDGIVLKRQVEPGQTMAASLQTPVLFTLAENLAQMELHVDVDEADVGQVAEGQGAEFGVDAYPDRRFPARIEQVRFAAETVDGVVTYETMLSVDNSRLELRPGMTATAEILVRSIPDALLVPNAALRFSPPKTAAGAKSRQSGGLVSLLLPRPAAPDKRKGDSPRQAKAGTQRVWVLKDGEPSPIEVRTGATDGTQTEILEGEIEPGTELVVDSAAPPK